MRRTTGTKRVDDLRGEIGRWAGHLVQTEVGRSLGADGGGPITK